MQIFDNVMIATSCAVSRATDLRSSLEIRILNASHLSNAMLSIVMALIVEFCNTFDRFN